MLNPTHIMAALEKEYGSTQTWAGNCYALATAAVQVGVPGIAEYGHWLGPVVPGTVFGDRASTGFVRHGWVKLPNGTICDPTRWVFEGKDPYIYIGPNDHYDMGGNAFRRATRRPAPEWDSTENQVKCTVRSQAWNFIEKILHLDSLYDDSEYKLGYVSHEQMRWLANLDLDTLGPHAEEIYLWIVRAGHASAIPIDNRRHVLEGVK